MPDERTETEDRRRDFAGGFGNALFCFVLRLLIRVDETVVVRAIDSGDAARSSPSNVDRADVGELFKPAAAPCEFQHGLSAGYVASARGFKREPKSSVRCAVDHLGDSGFEAAELFTVQSQPWKREVALENLHTPTDEMRGNAIPSPR